MDQVGMFLLETLPTGAAVLLMIALWWEVLVASDGGRRAMLIERYGIRGYVGLSLVKLVGVCAASAATAAIWWFVKETWWKGLAMLGAMVVSPWVIGTIGSIFIAPFAKNDPRN